MSNLIHKAPTPKTPTLVFHPRVKDLRVLKSKLVKETRDLQFKIALDRIASLEAQVKDLHALFSARLCDDIDFREEFENMRVHMKKMRVHMKQNKDEFEKIRVHMKQNKDEFEKMRVHMKQNKKAVHPHFRHF